MSIPFHGEKIIFISPIKFFAAFETRAVFPVQSLKTVKSFLQSGNLCEGGFVSGQRGIFELTDFTQNQMADYFLPKTGTLPLTLHCNLKLKLKLTSAHIHPCLSFAKTKLR